MIRPNLIFCLYHGILFLLSTGLARAQEDIAVLPPALGRQLQLTVDNDAYFFTDYDRYYSSGIFASYTTARKSPLLFKPVGKKGVKYSYDIRFSHYIFTPKNILWNSLDQLDRPYAGVATLGLQLNYFYPKAALTFGLDGGWLGPAIKTAELQTWWHQQLNIRRPRGWEHQIGNSPALVFQADYFRQMVASRRADLVYRSGIAAGTVFNKLAQEVVVRYGKPGALHESQLTNSLIGKANNNKPKYREWYLFAALQGSYVLYNATIDGNLTGFPSAYTEESEPFVWLQTYGVVVAGSSVDFELSFKLNSPEVTGAEHHRYMRSKISYRF